ncbi:hypothetical protein [Echinicola sp. 20G]|uniref:hypothetical protein n=1 Tax=Echinicola sp. 20G TaxID=2781961 RepID=UPI001910EC4B|nr:hypothetical protein [Echinicola sp. 20G]
MITRTFILLVFAGFLSQFSFAQEIQWEKVFEIKIADVQQLDIDNTDKIYLTDSKGNITVYNHLGDSINSYSPTYQGSLSQFEVSRTVNIFTFSKDLQRIEILDRFLAPRFSGRLNFPEFGNIKAASLGNNLKVWLYDETDFSILQYDYQRNTVLQKQTLNLILDEEHLNITEITEYKNTLFINTQSKGIFLLDNQGNYLGDLPFKTSRKLSFNGSYLLTTQKGELILTHFISGTPTRYKAPCNASIVSTGNKIIVFYDGDSIHGYKTPSSLSFRQ